jgi:hypothetical protein
MLQTTSLYFKVFGQIELHVFGQLIEGAIRNPNTTMLDQILVIFASMTCRVHMSFFSLQRKYGRVGFCFVDKIIRNIMVKIYYKSGRWLKKYQHLKLDYLKISNSMHASSLFSTDSEPRSRDGAL